MVELKMFTNKIDDEEENEIQRVTKSRKHQSIPKQRKLNRSPSSKKHRSPTKKRMDSIKLTKEEIKYQRFVYGLKTDIHTYLNKCLRESHFDPRGGQDLSVKTKRINETNNVVNNHRQRSMKLWKNNENKRLNADVNEILTGPSMKLFYTEFVHPRTNKSTPVRHLRPLEESVLLSNEQE